VSDSETYSAPLVICASSQRFFVEDQLAGLDKTLICEAMAKNTAFAIAAAAEHVARTDPDAVMLVLAADHAIVGQSEFDAAVDLAAAAARQGYIVAFGCQPAWAETGFGYVLPGAPIPDLNGVRTIARFVEKPDHKTAQGMVENGRYLWNNGIFVATAATFLEEIGTLAPATSKAARQAYAMGVQAADAIALDPDSSAAAPDVSVDVAIMEKTAKAAIVTGRFAWTDVGSWKSVWMMQQRDSAGTAVKGEVVHHKVTGSYLHSDGPVIAAAGLEDIVVVATEDAVLVAHQDHIQSVKKLVAEMKAQQRPQATTHKRVYRPWGYYECIGGGEGFQTKILHVAPGAQLSLQSHRHRSEHWTCAHGVASAQIEDEWFDLSVGESIDVPLGAIHRLANNGEEYVQIVEVQFGEYLGEDDIIRYEDVYGRA